MIRTLLKPLSFLPALLLMYMIFSFSAQPGEVSSQMSYKVSYKIVETANYIFDGNLQDWQISEWSDKINFITRKLAHMAEYFALAVAVSFPLYVYGLHGIWLMLAAGLICVGFACGDEYHQAFVAGRSPSKNDVCIDSAGVLFGILLVRIVGWTGRKTIFKPKEKEETRRFRKSKQPSCQNPDEDWLDEEDIDIDSPPDPFYSPDWHDDSRKDDWGMDDRPPLREQPPFRETEAPPRKRKKVKKEKDWFFDM